MTPCNVAKNVPALQKILLAPMDAAASSETAPLAATHQPSQNQYACKQLHTHRLASSAASDASCSLVSAVPDRSSDRSRSSSMSCTFLFSAAISLSACKNVLTTSELDNSKFRHYLLRGESFRRKTRKHPPPRFSPRLPLPESFPPRLRPQVNCVK